MSSQHAVSYLNALTPCMCWLLPCVPLSSYCQLADAITMHHVGHDCTGMHTYSSLYNLQVLPAQHVTALKQKVACPAMNGGVVAWIYVRHGTFWIDAISLTPAPLEVQFLHTAHPLLVIHWPPSTSDVFMFCPFLRAPPLIF